MRRWLFHSLSLIVCAVLAHPAGALGPSAGDGEPTPMSAPGLVLVLSVDKASLLVGEPAPIQLRVENHGGQAVTGDFYPRFDMDRVHLTITPQGGAASSYVSEAMAIAKLACCRSTMSRSGGCARS